MDEVDRWLAAAGISLLDTPLSTCAPPRVILVPVASSGRARGAGVGFDAGAAARASTKIAPVGAAGEASTVALEAAVRRGQKRRAEEEAGGSNEAGRGGNNKRGGGGRGGAGGRGRGGGGGGTRGGW